MWCTPQIVLLCFTGDRTVEVGAVVCVPPHAAQPCAQLSSSWHVVTCPCIYLPPVLQGKPLIDGTLESIKHVMKGLDIATSNPRCALCWGGDVISRIACLASGESVGVPGRRFQSPAGVSCAVPGCQPPAGIIPVVCLVLEHMTCTWWFTFLQLTAETPINHTSSHTALVLWWPSPSSPPPPPATLVQVHLPGVQRQCQVLACVAPPAARRHAQVSAALHGARHGGAGQGAGARGVEGEGGALGRVWYVCGVSICCPPWSVSWRCWTRCRGTKSGR